MPTKQGFGVNLALLIGVALPCVVATYFLRTECPALAKQPSSNWWDLSNICKLGIEHPVWALNVIYFINVNIIFWIISLWQDSTWLIDPYWTIIPVLIAHFYHAHPTAQYDPMRARVVLALVWIWSIRLTHSYFRREEWKLGAREDWRFADMRKDYGKHWWWISFFACYISQHVMLVGITLPFYAVFSSAAPFTNSDWLIAAAALGFIVLAYFADTQLREFMQTNENRTKSGKSKILILKTGVWRWSRHPNYFGELSWWWTVAFFGLQLASPVYFAGTVANTAAMAVVTYMVEKRMSAVKERVAAWDAYKAVTSVWVPLPLFLFFKERSVSPAKSPAKPKGPAKPLSSPKRAVNNTATSPAKAKPSPKKSQSPRRQKTA